MREIFFHREWILLAGVLLLGVSLYTLVRISFPDPASPESPPATIEALDSSGESELFMPASGDEGAGQHTVAPGETLAQIAGRYGVTVQALAAANNLSNPDLIFVGQVLDLPEAQAPVQIAGTVAAKAIIPDSELVYGPSARDFDLEDALPRDSYLRRYRDTVEGVALSGPAVVRLVAERTRVHPRLLLAALEHRSGWVTRSNPDDDGQPLQLHRPGAIGLYMQLEWAANQFNLGYYGRSEGGLTAVTLADGNVVAFDPDLNNGTAGVYQWLGAHSTATLAGWQQEIGPDGFRATYERLFGDPFDYDLGPLLPDTLTQPDLALPWEAGETWYFTGGPHGGWISGSAWAALDFVPPGEQVGCYEADAWLTAAADGVIARSEFGAVVLDLDGDGFSGTGWALLYQHIATENRVPVGSRVRQGDRIGHPSCEGGYSTGTHLHLARTYNGRWISADREPAFTIGGWRSQGFGSEYNGLLIRGGDAVEASVTRSPGNAVTAPAE